MNKKRFCVTRLSYGTIVSFYCWFMCSQCFAVDSQYDLLNPIREHEFSSPLKIEIHVTQVRKVGQELGRMGTTLCTPGTVTIPQCAEIRYKLLGLDATNAVEYRKVVESNQIKRLALANIDDNVLSEAGKAGLFDGLEFLEICNSPKLTSFFPLVSIGNADTLQTLRLDGTAVRDVDVLSKLKNLVTLDLSGNPITDISALSKMRKLTKLYLFGTEIRDVTPLASLKKLTVLHLGNTRVRDIRALASLTELTELALDSKGVTDTTPLAGLVNVKALYLGDTNVNDLAPLANLKDLEHLSLSAATASEPDFRPLFQLKKLKKIQYTGQLASETIEELKEHLPQCRIVTWSD